MIYFELIILVGQSSPAPHWVTRESFQQISGCMPSARSSNAIFCWIFYLFYLFKFLYCCSNTVVPIFLSPLFPPPPPPSIFSPFGFVHGSFTHVHWQPFPFNLHTPSLLVPVSLFLISMSPIYFAYLFCWLGSTYRWDHMVFVFHLRISGFP